MRFQVLDLGVGGEGDSLWSVRFGPQPPFGLLCFLNIFIEMFYRLFTGITLSTWWKQTREKLNVQKFTQCKL